MTCCKPKNVDRSVLDLRYALTTAFALALIVVCFLFVATNPAQGQPPASVLKSMPEETEIVQVPPATGPPIELAPASASFRSVSVASQDATIDYLESGVFVDSFDALPGNFQDATCEMTQNIQVRKNVLGCKACYNVLPQDELWIVSARGCSCEPENVGLMKVKRLKNNCWQESSLNVLADSHLNDTSRTTMVYVHGNQTNYKYGISRGVQFYNNLFVEYQCPRPPVRLVLWLWQSEREAPRLYSDYIVKSHRAVRMGKTLKRTLEALGDRNLALVGFSLGAQVVLSSLEHLESDNGCLLGDANQHSKYNVALIAPATDPDYICSKIDRCVQSTIVRQSTVIVNDDDRAVKAMRFVIRHECPEARDGFCRLARSNHLPLGKTEFFEISQEICRKHSIVRYTRSPSAQRAMTAVLNRTAAEAF